MAGLVGRPPAAPGSPGWSLLRLCGLDPCLPRARIGRMGAAFLVVLRGHQVVEVDRRAILMVARTGAWLRVYRGEPDPEVVLAWDLCEVTAAGRGRWPIEQTAGA
jgi:hypothetical protein